MEETQAAAWHAATLVAERRMQNIEIPAEYIELKKKYADLRTRNLSFSRTPPFYPLEVKGTCWDYVRMGIFEAGERWTESGCRSDCMSRITCLLEDIRLPKDEKSRAIVESGNRGELKPQKLIYSTDEVERYVDNSD